MTEAHLTAEQCAALRADLESALARLERQVARSAAATRPVELDQTAVGRLSRMDAMQHQGLAAGAHARAEQELAQVRDALSRLDAGTYGRCQNCGRAIGLDRLGVMPEARDCTTCSRMGSA